MSDQNNMPKVPLAQRLPEPGGKTTLTNEELARNQVLASREIDKKTYLESSAHPGAKPQASNNQISKKKFDFKNFNFAKSIPRAYLIVGFIFFCCFIFIFFTLYSDADNSVIKNTLEGQVVDKQSQEGIPGAKITVGEKTINADSNGKYKISGLDSGKIKIKVEAEGYFTTDFEVSIGSTILSYTTNKNFELEKIKGSQIKGKFIIDSDLKHNFLQDSLYINDVQVTIDNSGTFFANGVEGDTARFVFKSAEYFDIDKTFAIIKGLNELSDIELEPSGEINADFVSFISEDIVLDAEVIIETVPNSKISIDEDGKMKVADLEIGRTYKIRINAPKYLTRDYEVTVKQGINLIPNFRLVEEGFAIFLKDPSVDLDSLQFYRSDFDGGNLKQLTDVVKLNPVAQYFNADENLVYFLSDKDRIDSTIRSDAFIAYSLKVDTQELKKLTTNTTNLGTIIPNFKAKKLVNITTDGQNRNSRVLVLMDIDGGNRVEIRKLQSGEFSNIIISDDGNFVYFYEKNFSSGINSLYQFDVQNKKINFVSDRNNIVTFDSSFDGTRIVYSALNDSTSFTDLFYTDTKINETRTISQNFKGSQFRFVDGSNKDLLFFKTVENEQDLFTINIETGSEQRLTNLDPADKISYVYEENQYVFYITQKGLHVLDLRKPKSFKLVNSSVNYYSGYDISK